MSSTLRERKQGLVPVALWALATLLCAVAGPFGTLDALGFGGRAVYWGVVVAVSIAGSLVCHQISLARGPVGRLGVWSGYVLVLAAGVHGLNSALFDIWQGWSPFLYLLGIVGVTVIVVQGTVAVARHALDTPAPAAPDVDPQALFLRRIPLDKRGPLLRLEAQDHYLNVVTQKGSALILMRLQDAIEALQDVQGLRVHRSHWVMLGAVAAHKREKGRDFLILTNGDAVPVSRSFRADAQAGGLI